MISIIMNDTPTVDESLNTFNLDVCPAECSFCGTPHPTHKPVDFANIGLKFCNQLCEDSYNYIEYINNKYDKNSIN